MPRITENVFPRPSFQKKSYRPWTLDLLGDDFNKPNDDKLQTQPVADPSPTTEKNVEQSQGELEGKSKTNLGQTQDKLRTNSRQTGNKLKTNLGHISHQKQQIQDKLRTKLRTNHKTNLRQIQDKPKTNLGLKTKETSFFSLVGLQKKVMLLIYENCKFSRDGATSPLAISYIAEACETSDSSVQKTIQRLEQKGVLSRKEFKSGRGGWTKYVISKNAHQEIVHNETQDKLRTNLGQTQDNPRTEPKTELRTTLSSSSGFNNYLNTTTTSEEKNERFIGLDEEWSEIDFEPLANIGFTKTHLKQISSQELLKPDMVQCSIHAFAFDLENNGKGKSIRQPLNYFMGILRKGQPYAPPDNYECPKDKAMRLYIEKIRKIEQRREAMQKEMMDLAFSDWFNKLTDDELKKLLPAGIGASNKMAAKESAMVKGAARNYFMDNVWSTLKNSIESSEA